MADNVFENQLTPGLMVTQAWREVRGEAAATQAAFEAAVTLDFFQAYQVVDIPTSAARTAIGALMRHTGRALTYSLGRRQTMEGLNLAALDEGARCNAVATVASYFDEACELHAPYVQVLSGPAPASEQDRRQALEQLHTSISALAEAAAARDLILMIEPLDIAAHKKGALGTTAESVALIEAIHSPALKLCFDTAHARLNGEDIVSVLELAAPHIGEFHFCNCVIEPNHELYGDHHIPFGTPGWLDSAAMAHIFRKGRAVGLWSTANPMRTFCEIRRPEGVRHTEMLQEYQRLLETAWERSLLA